MPAPVLTNAHKSARTIKGQLQSIPVGGAHRTGTALLAACFDQVRFMGALLAPEALSGRVREFVAAEVAGGRLDARIGPLLEAAVLFGEVPRGEVPGLVGTSDRQARRLVRPLVDRGLLTGAKDAPLRVAFPLGETERLFPHLWAPSGVASVLPSLPEVDEALRLR